MPEMVNKIVSLKNWNEIVKERAESRSRTPRRIGAESWIAHGGPCPSIKEILGRNSNILRVHPSSVVPSPTRAGKITCDVFDIKKNNRKRALVIEPTGGTAFADTVHRWINGPVSAKKTEIRKLHVDRICEKLGLEKCHPGSLRYRFFSVAYATVKMAEMLEVTDAIMIVLSVRNRNSEFRHFENFCNMFEVQPTIGQLSTPVLCSSIELQFGWVRCIA